MNFGFRASSWNARRTLATAFVTASLGNVSVRPDLLLKFVAPHDLASVRGKINQHLHGLCFQPSFLSPSAYTKRLRFNIAISDLKGCRGFHGIAAQSAGPTVQLGVNSAFKTNHLGKLQENAGFPSGLPHKNTAMLLDRQGAPRPVALGRIAMRLYGRHAI